MIGQIVGSYKITDKIGEGGMGEVFKGVDLMLEREVAIKVLRPEFSSQPEIVERFRSEAVTLAKLNHPNIATLHSFFRQGDNFFMVMEFVRGEALDSIIKRSGALPCDRAISLFCQALEGIGRAHKLGIIHRDIKPANVMLTAEDGSIKVMDFGIARVLGTARMTRQGNIIGTIEYMSPEAIQGSEVDARSDIYSLGILLYEMLTGRVPFAADTEFKMMMAHIQEAPPPPRDFAPHIPVAVEAAIMRALAKKQEARYQTVGDFRAVLEQAVAKAPSPARPVAPQAAPPTRVAPAAVTSQPQGGVPRETRLADRPATTPASPPPSLVNPPAPPYSQPAHRQPVYQAAPARASFIGKLTGLHYAIGAVILLALAAIPVAVFLVGQKHVPTQQSPVSQPAPTGTKSAPNEPRPTAVPAPQAPEPSTAAVPPGPATTSQPGPEKVESMPGPNTDKTGRAGRKDALAEARDKARRRAEAKRLLEK